MAVSGVVILSPFDPSQALICSENTDCEPEQICASLRHGGIGFATARRETGCTGQ
jgi:hypothetical protein